MAPVLLKWWSPLFDREHEQIGAGLIWVRLPGLPLQFWSEEVFIRIGNALGTYLDHDRTFVESKNRNLARDTREGLEEKITLQWGKYIRVQILDYKGVPFRCRHCHGVGHLFKECPYNQKSEDSPKITPTPTRVNSPVGLHPSPTGQAPVDIPPISKTVDSSTKLPSLPMTRARSPWKPQLLRVPL